MYQDDIQELKGWERQTQNKPHTFRDTWTDNINLDFDFG